MTDQTPQPPQENQEDAKVIEAEDAVVEVEATESPEEAPQLSYHEYLKLMNPDKSDEEIAKMIRKETRYAWLVRFQILALIVFVILIIYFILVR